MLENYGKGQFREFADKDLPDLIMDEEAFPELFFAIMVNTSNEIISRRLSPYPALYNYVYAVYSLSLRKQSQASFDAWHKTVDQMIESKNSRKFDRYMELSGGFFFNGQLYEASNYSWFYDGGEFIFDYDNKPIIKFKGGNLICRVGNNDKKK